MHDRIAIGLRHDPLATAALDAELAAISDPTLSRPSVAVVMKLVLCTHGRGVPRPHPPYLFDRDPRRVADDAELGDVGPAPSPIGLKGCGCGKEREAHNDNSPTRYAETQQRGPAVNTEPRLRLTRKAG